MKLLKRIWNDPVGSQVISGSILLGGPALLVWFSGKTRSWLFAPVVMSRAWIALLVVFAVLLIVAVWRSVRLARTVVELQTKERQRPNPAPPQPAPLPPLEEVELAVLRFLGETGDGMDIPLEMIVDDVGATEQRILLARDRLNQRNFVQSAGLNDFGVQLISITGVGREECHARGWL